MPCSIFSHDFFFFDKLSNSERQSEGNDDMRNTTNENPSSNESRADPNKEEIENIVVSMVKTSEKIKN